MNRLSRLQNLRIIRLKFFKNFQNKKTYFILDKKSPIETKKKIIVFSICIFFLEKKLYFFLYFCRKIK